jgi:transcription antitermination factor NusG
VFVWVELGQWSVVRGISGVRDFLRVAGQPVRVDKSIVDELRSRESPTGYVRLRPRPVSGQRVRLADDSGVSGICVGDAPAQRLRVLLSVLGREVEMEFRERDLIAE